MDWCVHLRGCNARHSIGEPPVLFTKTVMRAPVRKAVVRVRSACGRHLIVCSKEGALEVLHDTGTRLGEYARIHAHLLGAHAHRRTLAHVHTSCRPPHACRLWHTNRCTHQICSSRSAFLAPSGRWSPYRSTGWTRPTQAHLRPCCSQATLRMTCS